MSLKVAIRSEISVVETFTGDFVSPNDRTVTFNGLSETLSLTNDGDVPVTKHADYTVPLSSGVATVNLAALPGKTLDELLNATGLKLQGIKLKNPATNAHKITATRGASNGYGLCASGDNWILPLSPGQSALLSGNEANPDVASGARTIDLAGTGAEVLDLQLLLG